MLLRKSEMLGFETNALDILYSLLTQKTQKVHLKDCFSDKIEIKQEVHQGKAEGPLVFNTYADDLDKQLDNNCKMRHNEYS